MGGGRSYRDKVATVGPKNIRSDGLGWSLIASIVALRGSVAVNKYKPRATPHALGSAVERAASAAEKTLAESKKAIARSRELVEQSRQAVEGIRKSRKRA